MVRLFAVDDTRSDELKATTMEAQHLTEPRHLESWIVQNPEAIVPGMMVVATQYNAWASDVDRGMLRLDVLGLTTDGDLVVVELKRGHDANVHLQALTYAALSSTFTPLELARAHAAWVRRQRGEAMTEEAALEVLTSFVDVELTEQSFTFPRMVLVAESSPGEVLTTVQWLTTAAEDLSIERHTYTLFHNEQGMFVAFDRQFPIDDLSDQMMRAQARARVAETNRLKKERAAAYPRTAAERQLIPEGTIFTLDVDRLSGTYSEQIRALLNEDPDLGHAEWAADPQGRVLWHADTGARALRSFTWIIKELGRRAGYKIIAVPGPSMWLHEGKSVVDIVKEDEARNSG